MTRSAKNSTINFGLNAVWMNLFGIIFSGLVFPVLTAILVPQPAWKDAALFIQSFHPLQTVTFFCGFFLVIGSLLTFIALYQMSDESLKTQALSALIVNTVFTAVVFLNYVIQTTYIPYLATNHPPESQYIIPVFTMANPGSFAWALEMYGWGGIGLSYLMMSRIFREESTLRILFLLNGISSIASALVTSFNMNWLFSPAGFAALITWNLLVLIIDIYLIRYFRHQKI
jgi:hypothetical protein